ncbi:MAG: MFS transporter [Alphaproteobacteria bacterium]|nr:MFS transporter [Alphaproteobacteria bacterium]
MRGSLLAVASIIGGIFILQAGNGLLSSFLTLRMALEQFPAPVIGLVVTGYPLGFLIGCLGAPRLIGQIGHIRAFAVLASTFACATLALAVYIEPFFWSMVRILSGFAGAGLFMIGESWLNEKSPQHLRGRIFGLYTISNMTAVSASQFLLTVGNPLDLTLFMLAAGFICASLIPVAMTRSTAPTLPRVRALNVFDLYRLSPVGVVGAISAGLCNTALGSIGLLYGERIGLSTDEIARFMAALLFGGLLLQWPIGRLSDRMDRRKVLTGVMATAVLSALVIALFGQRMGAALYLAILFYGGLVYTVYPLAVAHANDIADRSQVVAVSSGLLLSWSLGSIAGPTLASAAMGLFGPSALFFYTAGVSAFLALFTLWRITRRAAPEKGRQLDFVAKSPTTITPIAAEMHPRAEAGEPPPTGEEPTPPAP